MEINRSIVHRFFVAIMTLILFLASGIYSCVRAQAKIADYPASTGKLVGEARLTSRTVNDSL